MELLWVSYADVLKQMHERKGAKEKGRQLFLQQVHLDFGVCIWHVCIRQYVH